MVLVTVYLSCTLGLWGYTTLFGEPLLYMAPNTLERFMHACLGEACIPQRACSGREPCRVEGAPSCNPGLTVIVSQIILDNCLPP